MTPVLDSMAQGPAAVFALCATDVRGGLARIMAAPPLCLLDEGPQGMAELVLAEVLNNIAEHAYAGAEGGIDLSLRLSGGMVWCEVVDQGAAMPGGNPPAGVLPQTVDLALDDLPEGGFGWHLIRSLTQGLTYARSGDRNHLGFGIAVAE
jgi:serine/threonine-protein kinase RsbW